MVCGPCSNKKLLLPGQGNGKAVRVCLQCYDAASKIKAIPATAVDSLNNKDPQRNSADSSGGDSSGDDDDANKEENHDEVINFFLFWIKINICNLYIYLSKSLQQNMFNYFFPLLIIFTSYFYILLVYYYENVSIIISCYIFNVS